MIRVYTDHSKSDSAGAKGNFQVISVVKEDSNGDEIDLTAAIDQGFHYDCIEDVLVDLKLNPRTTDFEHESI